LKDGSELAEVTTGGRLLRLMFNASRSSFKVNGSKRIIVKKRYNSSPDKLSKFRLGEKYLRVECNTLHGVQGY